MLKQLQSFQNRFAKEIVKAKEASAEALTLLRWVPLHARRIGHRCCLVQDALKGKFPNILMCSGLQWASNSVIILEMVTCLQSAGQERNKQKQSILYCRVSSRDSCQKPFLITRGNSFYWTILNRSWYFYLSFQRFLNTNWKVFYKKNWP